MWVVSCALGRMNHTTSCFSIAASLLRCGTIATKMWVPRISKEVHRDSGLHIEKEEGEVNQKLRQRLPFSASEYHIQREL